MTMPPSYHRATARISGVTNLNDFWAYEKADDSDMSKYDILDNMVRQGDVVLYPIDKLPQYAQLQQNTILALGEKSGHKHLMNGQVEVYETPEPERIRLLSMAKVNVKKFVKVLESSLLTPTYLEHQNKQGQKADHDKKKVNPGVYAVLNEVEYNPFEDELKQVED